MATGGAGILGWRRTVPPVVGCNTSLMEMPGSLRRDLLQIAFLPRYPDDEELQVASAVIYE